jgi:adenylate cyclase
MDARERLYRANRAPGAIAALRRVRRLLPGDPHFGDPLSTAGQGSASTVARLADKLFEDDSMLTRELSLGALQVWQSMLDKVGRGAGDTELTILFTDLVGFSSWAMTAGDDEALSLLRQVAAATEAPVIAERGRVVKRLGDGLMAVFPTAQLAFDSVCEAQRRLDAVEVAGYHPVIRAGIHTGRPRSIGGDYVGVDVNIAARLAERASGREVLMSEPAVAQLDTERVSLRRKKSFIFARPKGVPDDLTVFVASPAA